MRKQIFSLAHFLCLINLSPKAKVIITIHVSQCWWSLNLGQIIGRGSGLSPISSTIILYLSASSYYPIDGDLYMI